MSSWTISGTKKATGFEYLEDPKESFGYCDYPFKNPDVYLEGVVEEYNRQWCYNWSRDSVVVRREETLIKYSREEYFKTWCEINGSRVLCEPDEIPEGTTFTGKDFVPVYEYFVSVYDLKSKTKTSYKTVVVAENVPYADYEVKDFINGHE